MDSWVPAVGLLVALILLNAVFAGSEIALISLREGQLRRLERRSAAGRRLAHLAGDPNRFLSTIQIGITLSGFLASAFAAITLAQPLVPYFDFFGSAAEPAAIVVVTAALTFVTLVVGEIAPKRIAMQRAEQWALFVARPLDVMATAARPLVWLLGRATDLVVRLLGGDPALRRGMVTEEELRDLIAGQTAFSEQHRTIISGAFEIGSRTLREVLVPRVQVFSLPSDLSVTDAVVQMAEAGFSRAPVVERNLDEVVGVASLRILIGERGAVADHADPPLQLPESVTVVAAVRALQAEREQMAIVVDEHGGVAGLVTLEDLIEELVGEIYDETDPDVLTVVHDVDESVVVPGSFPMHDLVDLGIDLPEGEYATVAGLVLDRLGYVPTSPGAVIEMAEWTLEVMEVRGRAVTRVRIRRSERDRPRPEEEK